MTNEQIIEKIIQWQNAGFVPEVTCPRSCYALGLDHGLLAPIEKEGKVILICKSCDWVQEYIPIEILGNRLEERRKEVEKEREKNTTKSRQ